MDKNTKPSMFKLDLYNLFKQFISILFIGLISLTILESIFYRVKFNIEPESETYTSAYEIGPNLFLMFVMFITFTFISYLVFKLYKKYNNKKINKYFLATFFVFILAFFVYWFINSYSQPMADQGEVLKDAVNILNGDKSLSLYYMKAPQQVGLLYFEVFMLYPITLITKLDFNLAVKIFNIYNIIFLLIIFIFTNLIAIEPFKKNENKEESIFSVFPMSLITINFALLSMFIFIYGDIPGLMFSIISIYLLLTGLRKESIKILIGAIITLALAMTIRSNYLIFFIAINMILIFEYLPKLIENIKRVFDKEKINEKSKNIKQSITKGCIIIFMLGFPLLVAINVIKTYPNKWENQEVYPVSTISYIAMGISEGSMGPRVV